MEIENTSAEIVYESRGKLIGGSLSRERTVEKSTIRNEGGDTFKALLLLHSFIPGFIQHLLRKLLRGYPECSSVRKNSQCKCVFYKKTISSLNTSYTFYSRCINMKTAAVQRLELLL